MTFFEAYTAMKAGAWIARRHWLTGVRYLFRENGQICAAPIVTT